MSVDVGKYCPDNHASVAGLYDWWLDRSKEVVIATV